MAINILDIQPSVISRDLRGKYICIYGPEKCGKTTFAAQQEKTLILAFEKGTNFLPNVFVQPIVTWSDFKLVLRQLKSKDAQEKYHCIAIDTVAEAYQLCEDFICAQNGVQKIGDIPYGQGYAACKKEFESSLRSITMMGYGIIAICHSQKKNLPGPDDTVIEQISPAMPARAADVINRLVDLIGYIKVDWDEFGNSTRTLLTRSTPYIMAGSRLRYLEPEIPFGYKELVNAISDAIDKQAKMDGITVVDHLEADSEESLNYNELMDEARELWTKLIEADEANADKVLKKIEILFGQPKRISEITEDQVSILNLVVLDMKELAAAL